MKFFHAGGVGLVCDELATPVVSENNLRLCIPVEGYRILYVSFLTAILVLLFLLIFLCFLWFV